MNVKMLKTMSGLAGVQRAGSEHEIPDDEALRLIEAGIAEPTDPTQRKQKIPPPPPQTPADPADLHVRMPDLPWGSDEYLAVWDSLDQADVVAGIEAWGTGAGSHDDPMIAHPSAELIEMIEAHEQAHGNRQLVIATLDLVKSAASVSDRPPLKLVEPPAATVAELVDGNDRKTLDKLASVAGIQAPGKLKDKTAVADAIVAARSKQG